MSRAVITGVGVISPLGDSAAALGAALGEGRSGLAPVELFDPGDLACREAGEIRGFSPRDYLGDGNLRPLDRTAQLAAAGQTAIWHGLQGVNSTISGGPASGVQALGYARDQIRDGRAAALLSGGCEELCFECYYGFYRAGLVAGSRDGGRPVAVPFDRRRNGFVPGEGAALVMLEAEEAARRRGARVVAEIRGWGSAYDPTRGRDGERAAGAVARAIRAALADAGLEPGVIDAVSASASGSPVGDRAEAAGLAAVFGDPPPVTAVKSMLGEGLGAAGAFQTVALLEAMATGTLPGVRGLEEPDEGLPAGMAAAASRELEVRRGLVTAVGLDGQACALVVERREEP